MGPKAATTSARVVNINSRNRDCIDRHFDAGNDIEVLTNPAAMIREAKSSYAGPVAIEE
jgi:hypothetical protein